jgi:cytochrome P450
MKLPPGPPPRPFLGNLPDFAKDLLGFFEHCAREYGEVSSMRLGPRTAFLLTNPDHIEIVLVARHRDFVKHSFFWRHVRAVFGTGLLTSEGDEWLRQRRLEQPAFHRDRIAAYAEVMVAYTERILRRWHDGETRDVHRDMMGLTMEIVAKVLFDADVEGDVARVGSAFDHAVAEVAARFRRPIFIPDWLPIPGNVRYMRAVRKLDAVVYRFIAEHRDRDSNGDDLLSMLMRVRDADGSALSEKQLRDEAVTLLLAGHETTALTLTWTWVLLARHDDVERRLHDEIDAVLGGRPPTVNDVPRLRVCEHIIMESMRLYPPAYTIGREAVRDVEIGGWHVPAGTTLFVSPWLMHRDTRWFDEPQAFRPDRWDGDFADKLPRFAYMPFGGGPRICIGNRFAMMEAVLLLATIAQRVRFSLAGPMPKHAPTVTLRPDGPVRMTLKDRRFLRDARDPLLPRVSR